MMLEDTFERAVEPDPAHHPGSEPGAEFAKRDQGTDWRTVHVGDPMVPFDRLQRGPNDRFRAA